MGIVYPGSGIDTFSTPSAPEFTSLSEAGDSDRNHDESHEDIGAAVMALETHTAPLAHDHSGTDPSGLGLWPTAKLAQANTHQSPDTDTGQGALHHTLGRNSNQAAPGDLQLDWNATRPDILHRPYIICTSTTRPASPFPGMLIFETDTLATRMWMDPPGATGLFWQLVPLTSVPILRAESRAVQQVPVNTRYTCWFTNLLERLFFPRVDFTVNNTDIVIDEPGLYHLQARIHWDPARTFHDHSMIGITVNGTDVARNDWEFVRGFSYTPGFAQSNNINFWYRFQANDVLRLTTKHNGSNPSWLWYDTSSAEKQINHLELVFLCP